MKLIVTWMYIIRFWAVMPSGYCTKNHHPLSSDVYVPCNFMSDKNRIVYPVWRAYKCVGVGSKG